MAMLDKLHESRGAWIPRMVYRPDRAQEGIWGRWNAPGDKEKVYGFEPVVGFWFTGEKATPDEGAYLLPLLSLTIPMTAIDYYSRGCIRD
jgi:hypothetical protein